MPDELWWVRILTKMPDDEKLLIVESMPDRDAILWLWVRLIILAGKCNAGGYIFLKEGKPYSIEQLSHVFRRPLNTVRLALETFKNLDLLEINEDGFIFLHNFAAIQNTDKLDKIREQTRIRQAKFRAKKQLLTPSNVAVTLRNGQAEAEAEAEAEAIAIAKVPGEGSSQGKDKGSIAGNEKQEETQKAPAAILPSPADHIYEKILESFRLCFVPVKEQEDFHNGKRPTGKELAQLRDLAAELTAYKCAPALIYQGFKEATDAGKLHISYARAILLDWIGVER